MSSESNHGCRLIKKLLVVSYKEGKNIESIAMQIDADQKTVDSFVSVITQALTGTDENRSREEAKRAIELAKITTGINCRELIIRTISRRRAASDISPQVS